MIAFMASWTLCQIFREDYRHMLLTSLSLTLAYIIFIGLNNDVATWILNKASLDKNLKGKP